ncbi:hypothetical protein SAY86_009286 [Trapa natans]|uniref:DYW domain-containing protein n=1 Tax=Trapa natans TaxID=22666 RepID=A0AAN7L471_TRANT|nr:hypothetical protein SAY86_009286 [Trapa natans]
MNCRSLAGAVIQALDRNSCLRLLEDSSAVSHLAQTHAQVVVCGYKNDISTITKLIHKLCDFKAVAYARALFLSVPKPDLFLFNVLIRGSSNCGSPLSSVSLFTYLRNNTYLRPDNFTYAFTVSASSGIPDEKFGILLHAQAVVDGYGSDLFVGSSLVDFYFTFSKVEMAQKVFDRMLEKDTVLWNTMISGLVKNCCYEDSIAVFAKMAAGSGVRLDPTSVSSVLPAAAELQLLNIGLGIQCLSVKLGLSSHVHVLTGLISLYSKCGDMKTSKALFENIIRPDLISYNAMISGYTTNADSESSLRLFKELLGLGFQVNSSTIVGLIPVFYPFGHLLLTCGIHGFCVKSGIISNPAVSTALTTAYSRLNEIESARLLFNESKEKTLASWNAMISGYTKNGLTEKAISLFQDMQVSKMDPNPVTVTSILSACAQIGSLSLGKWVYDMIRRKGFLSNLYVLTALIDMYTKCGSIEDARKLFDDAPEKNVVTWNTMISGYGLHGHGQEAIDLFDEMMKSNIVPSAVTFLSVLYACSHAGLVDEGQKIFHSMVHDFGFEPLSEHYACMVDILGRAGKLEKALEFIQTMTVEPSPPVWGALLGACMIHKNTRLAQLASEKLFNLDPENVGYRVLLSNILSVDKKYAQAASVRQVVKQRNLVKTPGATLLEIGDIPYVFTAGDHSHPQKEAIYALLEKLSGKILEAGYKPETMTALHDVEEEEKELIMRIHSEKLAITFGLIQTNPGIEIRIFKNLRVCLDCHSWTKFVSKITERVIVVRDANRFHHFRDGACSCGDYW